MKNSTGEKSKSSPIERIFAGAAILTVGAGASIVAYFNPSNVNFFPVCPLYKFTGIHCPGCGLTRAFHALFHGDVLGALHYNALLPVFAFLIGFAFLSLLLIAVRGRGLSWRVFPPASLYGFVILSAAFFLLRNLPFYPFTLLAP